MLSSRICSQRAQRNPSHAEVNGCSDGRVFRALQLADDYHGRGAMVAAATYDYARFSITTDVEALISQSLPWHRRQLAFEEAFPQNGIAVVISAPTAENAEQATNALAQHLAKSPNLFRTVVRPDSGAFFEKNGLLFG